MIFHTKAMKNQSKPYKSYLTIKIFILFIDDMKKLSIFAALKKGH